MFIVDAGVEVVGDGKCDPAPDNCQTLTLKPGETVFLTRGDKQWELDLIKIHVKKTTDEGRGRAVARRDRQGRPRAPCASTARRIGRYRYSEATRHAVRGSEPEQSRRPTRGAEAGGAELTLRRLKRSSTGCRRGAS